MKVELNPVADAAFSEAAGRRKNVPFYFGGWFMDYPDPYDFLDVLLNGDRIVEVNCNNGAFYSSQKVNAILRRAASETDAGKRLALYSEDRKSTRLNSSHIQKSRMPSSA